MLEAQKANIASHCQSGLSDFLMKQHAVLELVCLRRRLRACACGGSSHESKLFFEHGKLLANLNDSRKNPAFLAPELSASSLGP